MASLHHLHAPPSTPPSLPSLPSLPSRPPLSFSTHLLLPTRLRPLASTLFLRHCSLTRLHALAESNSSPKSTEPTPESLLQELSDSLNLPADYFAKLPKDVRRRHLDAAADVLCGGDYFFKVNGEGDMEFISHGVFDECGQELGQTLMDLSQAWFSADTSTSHSLARKLPSLASSLADSERSAFGLRLISAGAKFRSTGVYGQGELQKISETMISAGRALCPSSSFTALPEQIPETKTRKLKFGEFEIEITPALADDIVRGMILLGSGCWIISLAIQSVPVSSLQFPDDNALQLAKSVKGALLVVLYAASIWSAISSISFLFIRDFDPEEE
ncbi:hypothetical protein Droror1_Dr00025050 [Drosera rotundifolia]